MVLFNQAIVPALKATDSATLRESSIEGIFEVRPEITTIDAQIPDNHPYQYFAPLEMIARCGTE